MLTAAMESLHDIMPRHVLGVSPTPAIRDVARATWLTGAHPVPDERSVVAARAVHGVAVDAGESDLLVLLLSGGASALMALPADGLTLADKRQASAELLRAGAEVHRLNAVRKHLSAIKGGQLAAATRGAVLTLAVSDVAGDDLSAIGSGPTVADATTFADALNVLDTHGGRRRYPPAVVSRFVAGIEGRLPETPKPGDPRLARSRAIVIGGAQSAVEGARAAAVTLGYRVVVLETPVVGDAREAAGRLVATAARLRLEHAAPLCVVSAGETTVRVSGAGKGGRNQECALAMAETIGQLGPAAAATSVGTDGVDGPTDAAGGAVDTSTLARATAAGLASPRVYLDDNNSYPFLEGVGDLVRTGPTGTNVGDLQVILIGA